MLSDAFKIVVYVPDEALDLVKNAMFLAGAGRFGHYDQCSWQTKGVGQFRPLLGANPAIGHVGELCALDEWRVEMIVPQNKLDAVVEAYRRTHPYEEPAFEVYQMVFVPD